MAAVAENMRSVGLDTASYRSSRLVEPLTVEVRRRVLSIGGREAPMRHASSIAEARKASEAIPRRAGLFWAMPMDGNARTRFSLGVLSALAHLGRLSRLHAQQKPRFWVPEADSPYKKFYWCTVTPTCFRVKPFDDHIEGFSRCGHETYAIQKAVKALALRGQSEDCVGLGVVGI